MSWLSDNTGINLDLPNKKFDFGLGGGGGAPTPPPEDPRLAKLRAEQQKQADDFKANSGNLKNQIYSDVQRTERGNVAKQITDSRNNYNSRGLLFSGMRQGAELGAQAKGSADLARSRSKINTQVDQQAESMRVAAIDSGLQAQKSQQSIQDEIYSNALSDFQSRNQGIGSLFGAVGQIGGSALAKGK